MPRRIPTLLILSLAGALAAAAPGQAEPRPGTVAGLDLASPERAAESFVRAWAEGDYFVAWLALDPELRLRFEQMLMNFDFRSIAGVETSAAFFDRYTENAAESTPPGVVPGFLVDRFADFDGFMRAVGQPGELSPRFDPSAMEDLVAIPAEQDPSLARVPVATAAGGGVLVLRRSPEGRWRLLGIEKREVAALWEYRAD